MSLDVALDVIRDWDFRDKYIQEISLATQQEPVDAEALSKKSFAERVKPVSMQGSLGTYLVDTLVSVVGPTDAVRAAALQGWQEKKENATFWGRMNVVALIGCIGGVGLAVASGAAFGPFEIAAAVLVLGRSALMAGKHYTRAEDAQKQIEQWGVHPAQGVADARAKAYAGGFFYAIQNGLKGSYHTISPSNILHPSEVTWLYEQNLIQMEKEVLAKMQRMNINPADKANWMEKLIAQNPFSKEAIAYAYEAADPKRPILEAWISSFEAFKQDIATLQSSFSGRIQQVRNQAWQQIHDLEKQRELALKLPLSLKNGSDADARRVRKNKLDEEGITDQGRKEANLQYEQAIRQNESYYLAAATPVNLYYDNWRKNVEGWEKNCLSQLQHERELGMAYYFEPALNLFNAAYGSWYHQNLHGVSFYQPGASQVQQELQAPPSAPPREAVGA